MQLIAIGGTIGVGLFLGSAKAIHSAGPGLLLCYGLAGVVIFFLMRALGELLLYRPVSGSFATYADEFVSPFAGFATGWSYWFMWLVVGIAEVTAIGVYVHYWFPDVPQWLSALVALLVLFGSNLLAVRVFGEVEFWFALIKVSTIILFIVAGAVIIIFKVGALGQTASVTNLWSHGGFFPSGIFGTALTLQIALFSYAGVEMIGLTAGEAQNPQKVLPRATNAIIARILIFYIGALTVLLCLIPWTMVSPNVSPFVLVFEKMGIPGAAGLMNVVVITAAASSCNSGMYGTGRLLFTLAKKGQAPAVFGRLNRRHIPMAGVAVSVAFMLIGVVLNYIVPDQVFTWLASIVVAITLWTWIMIMLSHRGYRRAVQQGRVAPVSYRMPFAPVANWVIIGFLLFAGVMLAFDPQTRIALYVAPIWFGIVAVFYLRRKRA